MAEQSRLVSRHSEPHTTALARWRRIPAVPNALRSGAPAIRSGLQPTTLDRELEDRGRLPYLERLCYLTCMRLHVPRAKIRAQSPVLAVVLLAILVMASALLGWLGGLVAWLIVLAALAVFVFCLRARP